MQQQTAPTTASIFSMLREDTWIKPFFTQYRKAMFASLALGILSALCAFGLMFTSGFLIDLSAEEPDLGVWSLFVPLGFVQLFGIGRPFVAYFERLKSHDWILHMTSQLRRRLYRSIDKNAVFWALTHKAGEALGLLSEDIGHVQDLYLRSIFPQVVACVLWIIMSIACGFFSVPLALMSFLVIGVLVVLLPMVAGMRHGARAMRRSQLQSQLYACGYDNVRGLSDWVFSGRRTAYTEHIYSAHAAMAEHDTHLARSARLRELFAQFVFCVFALIVFVWAARHFGMQIQDAAPAGHIRPADWIAAFAIGVLPLAEVFVPVSDASVQGSSHIDSIQRLNQLDEPRSDSDTDTQTRFAVSQPADIQIRDMHFKYAQQDKDLLHGLNLDIPAGQKIALIGRSGAGKSTLLSLIRGDLVPTSGSVRIAEHDAHELGEAVAQYMSVIQQDVYLFNQTLYENVALGNPTITREQAYEVLERVGLKNLLERLPYGLDTMVDEAGLRFSGGERHRIALARALCAATPIVILDEPCTSLDPMTEQAVLQTVFEVLDGRTIIMVTHHLLGVAHMDRVICIQEGTICMDGAPDELARSNERYQQLLSFDAG